MTGELWIGTSGWIYPHWRGNFYPRELRTDLWLDSYAQRFRTVELNNSFYRLPTAETFRSWADRVGPDFRFAVKGNRFITHMKKLRDPVEPIHRLFESVAGLGGKLGPVLFQLPPHWRFDPVRLEEFLVALPKEAPAATASEMSRLRFAFEFRDPSWLVSQAYEILARHGVGLCLYDLAGFVTEDVVTSDLVYVRLHGPEGKYAGAYSDAALLDWLGKFAGWRAEGRDVWCYFDNDTAGQAPVDALRMLELAGGDSPG